MKSDVEKQNGYFRKVNVEVPPERLAGAFQKVYNNLQKDADLKGFRKGKAPVNVLKQHYGESANKHIAEAIVQETLPEILKQHELEPVQAPKIEASGIAMEGFPYKYSAIFETKPPVILKEYGNFKSKLSESTATAEEMNKTIENICLRMAKFEALPAETIAAKGHIVDIDYTGTENGEKNEAACEKGMVIEIGMGILGQSFEENLVGMKVGDTKEFDFTHPKSDHDAATCDNPEHDHSHDAHPLAGKNIHYSVQLKTLKEKKVPALDDALAKQLGPFENVDALKKQIENDLKAQKDEEQKNSIRQQIVDVLIDQNPVDAPETMLQQQMQNIAYDSANRLARMGLPQNEIEEKLKEWEEDMQTRALKQVKSSLLLSAIAAKESIQAQEEDIRREIMTMAQQTGKAPQDIAKDIEEKGLFPSMVQQITELKALDWLLGKALN